MINNIKVNKTDLRFGDINVIIGTNYFDIRSTLYLVADITNADVWHQGSFKPIEAINNGTIGTSDCFIFHNLEDNRHPNDIRSCVELLSRIKSQIFLSTNSYFALKSLYLLTQKEQINIRIFVFDGEIIRQYNLCDGIPENSITNEYIELYKEEVRLSMA
jgi:hypothetical protein